MPTARSVILLLIGSLASVACGEEEPKYTPRTAPSGAKASLPPVPTVPGKPIKAGDAYTVWGASYTLRSRVHSKDIRGKTVKIAGYIAKTNLEEAPACAVHKTGKEDPEGCKPPIPAFWLCDAKDAPVGECIKVMGWASNYAQIYDTIAEYDKAEQLKKDPEPHMDAFWGVALPNPLPGKGAKVVVKGEYSTTFTRATGGAEADPIMGLLTYAEIEYQEKPPEKATLPGVKRK